MTDNPVIIGRLVPFNDGRMVFLSKKPDRVYIAFKNKDGQDTKFCLSQEAYAALIAMENDPDVGTPERSFPLGDGKPKWRLVSPAEMSADA